MRLALYQPDIPQNAGALMRLCACLGVGLDIIEPCGFLLDDRNLRRAGLDYVAGAEVRRHPSWAQFQQEFRAGPKEMEKAGRKRLILLTSAGAQPYWDFAFRPGDSLLLGRESAGVPQEVHQAADARLLIPMTADPSNPDRRRCLNVAQAAAMVLGEALRQNGLFPQPVVEAPACST